MCRSTVLLPHHRPSKPTTPEVAAIQKEIWPDRNSVFCAVDAALSNEKKSSPFGWTIEKIFNFYYGKATFGPPCISYVCCWRANLGCYYEYRSQHSNSYRGTMYTPYSQFQTEHPADQESYCHSHIYNYCRFCAMSIISAAIVLSFWFIHSYSTILTHRIEPL